MNSTIVALAKQLYGRVHGREASLQLDVYAAGMLPVPNLSVASAGVFSHLKTAFALIRNRQSHPLDEELSMADRLSLDDAVLELLGIEQSTERSRLLDALYEEVRRMYREMRDVEKEMQVFRRVTAHRDKASPRTIAEEIWGELDKSSLHVSPVSFIPRNDPTDSIKLPSGKAKLIEDLFDRGAVQINGHVLKLGSKARAEFAAKLVELGLYGEVSVPRSDRACQKALESYARHEAQLQGEFRELAEERSADPEILARIVRELWKLYLSQIRRE